MRATVSIDESLLKELTSCSGSTDYSDAVKAALKEYLSWKKWERILTLGNRVEWETDVLPKLDLLKPKNYRLRFTKRPE